MTASLKKLLADERVFLVAARVIAPKDGSNYWYINRERNAIVHVETINHRVPLEAIMCGADNLNAGIWAIPTLQTEVVIGFDNGEFEGDPYIVAMFGRKPLDGSGHQGPLDNVTTITATDEVHARSSASVSADAKSLALLETLTNLRNAIIGWTPVAQDGGAALKVALMALFGSTPPYLWPVGTDVFKAQ